MRIDNDPKLDFDDVLDQLLNWSSYLAALLDVVISLVASGHAVLFKRDTRVKAIAARELLLNNVDSKQITLLFLIIGAPNHASSHHQVPILPT